MNSFPDIPEGLAKVANGRDIILAKEVSFVTNTQIKTIYKHLCNTGSFHGAKPIKIGGRVQFTVIDIARLMRGETV